MRFLNTLHFLHPAGIAAVLHLCAVSVACAGEAAAPPSWTNASGTTIQAEFIRLEGETLVIRKHGKEFKLPLAKLSAASQEQARELARSAPGKPSASGSGLAATTAADRAQLLDGVRKVIVKGVPGSYCLLSPQAFPLVAGKVNDHLAAVAAGLRFGEGRVVALAHDGFLKGNALQSEGNQRLVLNAIRWAAGEGEKNEKNHPAVAVHRNKDLREFLVATGVTVLPEGDGDWKRQLASAGVFCTDGGAFPEEAEMAALRSFVEAGGGLIVCGCPWGWAQVTGKRLRTDYPLNRLLGPAGLVAAETYAKPAAEGGYSAIDPTPPLAHVNEALECLSGRKEPAPAGKTERLQAEFTLMTAIRSVPPDDQLLLPRLRALRQDPGRHALPLVEKPVGESDGMARLLIACEAMELQEADPGQIKAHPSARSFPYEVPADAARIDRELEVNTAVPGWHSTGLYAAPGDLIEVIVPDAAANQGLELRIGAHADPLWGLPEWKRWPSISWRRALASSSTRMANPFGGLIYIEVPQRCSLGTLPVRVSHAVEAPYFILGKTSPAEWREAIRSCPAPWAELECPGLILTVPSASASKLHDPEELMTFWNDVIRAQDELAAWQPQDRKRPERIVTDLQISAGYMHSGYPCMTHLDAAGLIVDLSGLRSGRSPAWGLFHELGHNHQDRAWTFDGAGEVTVNLFTRYTLEKVCGIPLARQQYRDAALQEKVNAYLRSGKDFETWKREPFLALAMYDQLVEEFGWESFRKTFAAYRELPAGERPETDAAKRDQWMLRFSRTVGKNLGPFFEAWAVPTSEEARASLAGLPVWTPKDFSG